MVGLFPNPSNDSNDSNDSNISNSPTFHVQTDILLIGAGIMSATLGTLLHELDPKLRIQIYERLDTAAAESSDAWNNAGTGHSAFCELNYTPQRPDGSVDVSKALKICAQFEESRQFWSYLVSHQQVPVAADFIRPVPHCSFVWGAENVAYLRKRYEALMASHLFAGMEYTEDPEVMRRWFPLIMEGRAATEPVAATRMSRGTDVNFGELTRAMLAYLQRTERAQLHLHHEVRDITRLEDGRWQVLVEDLSNGKLTEVQSPFVFIGAGGGSLPLLLQSGIPEAKGYGGFPVSGQWLRCTDEEVIQRHAAKVYGLAEVGAPPMSVPHLDTRMIKGRKELLFGPYAGFTTKFLKQGSAWDLAGSLRWSNLRPMLAAGWHNIPLTKYLIEQVLQSSDDKLGALRKYVPNAEASDWEPEVAGQRVQVIKSDEEEGGVLEFGTEVVSAADGSIAALLGASPGASTSVSIMLQLLEKAFGEKMSSAEWQAKLKEMIPVRGEELKANGEAHAKVVGETQQVLQA